jgi:hypothetical protein
MKRFAAALAIIACCAIFFSSCTDLNGKTIALYSTITKTQASLTSANAFNLPTDTSLPVPSPSPSATKAEATIDNYYKKKEIVPTTNVYSSTVSGITLTVPESWVGKYRVEEQGGYISVYFKPTEPVDTDTGDGQLFSINEKNSEEDELLYNSAVEFDVNGTTYICGTSKDESYQRSQPEYETYTTMQKDLPAVFSSIRTAKGQLPDNIIYEPKPAPMTLVYKSKSLHLAFSMPDSWKDKYTVMEGRDSISVFFKPEKPLTEENGDGWILIIIKKTQDTEAWTLDYTKEVTVNGVTYICGGPTDVAYSGEEDDLFMMMANEIWAVFDTIRAAK